MMQLLNHGLLMLAGPKVLSAHIVVLPMSILMLSIHLCHIVVVKEIVENVSASKLALLWSVLI